MPGTMRSDQTIKHSLRCGRVYGKDVNPQSPILDLWDPGSLDPGSWIADRPARKRWLAPFPRERCQPPFEPAMVHEALHSLAWTDVDYLFIENVSHLVCPAVYDLGHAANLDRVDSLQRVVPNPRYLTASSRTATASTDG